MNDTIMPEDHEDDRREIEIGTEERFYRNFFPQLFNDDDNKTDCSFINTENQE